MDTHNDEYSEDTKSERSEDSNRNERETSLNAGPSTPQKNLTRDEIKRLLRDMKQKYKQGEIKDTGVNTGGIKGAGKSAKKVQPKAEKRKTTKDYANKWKIDIPISEAVYIKPNMRGLVSNILAEVAYQKGILLRVIKGTQIIEISPE